MTKWGENRCQVRASVSTFQSPHVGFPSSWAVWEWSVLFCYQILPRLTESLYKFSLCQPPDQTRVFICRRQPEPDIKKKTLDNTLILLIWLASYNFVAWHTVVLWTISTCLTEWHTRRSVLSLVLGAITLTPPALWSPPANLDANGDLQGRDRMESEASHISPPAMKHLHWTLWLGNFAMVTSPRAGQTVNTM